MNLVGILVLSVFWTGCNQDTGDLLPEKEERAFRRGERFLSEGNYGKALLQFQDVIAERRNAPESHLEAGMLYLEHLSDPNSAIYHFNHYIGLAPNGEHVDRVRELINTAKKEFMRSLPGDPFSSEVERLDIYTRLQTVEAENVELRQQLARTREELAAWQERSGQLQASIESMRSERDAIQRPVAPIVVQNRPNIPTAPAGDTTGPRTYTVQAGDTLSKISREMYGTAGRWAEIFQANRDQLPSQNALRPGQVLRIP